MEDVQESPNSIVFDFLGDVLSRGIVNRFAALDMSNSN